MNFRNSAATGGVSVDERDPVLAARVVGHVQLVASPPRDRVVKVELA
jgi:hypothetical protein